MNREALISSLRRGGIWDILIIGGGATGLGIAVEASSRGLKTVLIEQSDFCKGTSSKSTKLIHGGVRYLQQGNLRLVSDALNERGSLLRNAPHIVQPMRFLIPGFHAWQIAYYGTGLKLYDLLAREKGLEKSRYRSVEDIRQAIPTISTKGLRGGIQYCDAAFDDAKLGICLARTASDLGAVLLNYIRLISFKKLDGKIAGGIAADQLTRQEFELQARVVINATGPFSDFIRRLDEPNLDRSISASRGSHIVVDRKFFPGNEALLVPKTEDGRVLFAIPWQGHVICGTTDTAVQDVTLEPKPSAEDLDFMLSHLGKFLTHPPQKTDILSAFAGFRPLVRKAGGLNTSGISRDHQINSSKSGLVSIIGGKWTTYRKMAEDVVDFVGKKFGMKLRRSETKRMPLFGSPNYAAPKEANSFIDQRPPSEADIAPLTDFTTDSTLDVIRAVREEWACTVEDVMARRTRILFLDARKAIKTSPTVAAVMAGELGKDRSWEKEQVQSFTRLAERYLP